jgi:hypothetical protein
VPVLLWVAIAVILVAVFFTATGRGGELAYEHADHAPLNLGSVSGADVALLRPPTALWGYNMQVTDTALDTIAQALRDRDVAIAHLQQQLTDLNYHVYGTTPAPPVGQDFPTRIDEGPLAFQPRPLPGRHEAQPLTPPEAWLAPAEAPAAEALPDPLVWEAPDPEPQQDQPWPSPEDQASPSPQDQPSPSAQDQFQPTPRDEPPPIAEGESWSAPQDEASLAARDESWSAPQDEPSPTAQGQAWSAPQEEEAPDPADQADPRAVGFAAAPDASAPDAPAPEASAADGGDGAVEQGQ